MHGHNQHAQTKSLVVWFLRYASGETDRQKNKHPYSSQYFAGEVMIQFTTQNCRPELHIHLCTLLKIAGMTAWGELVS